MWESEGGMMKAGRQIGILMMLLLVLTGCGEQDLSVIPTSTIAPSETAPPLKTATSISTNPVVPTPTEAISETGPWLVFSDYESQLVFRDIYSKNVVELQPPPDQGFRFHFNFQNNISPIGGRVALLAENSVNNTFELLVYKLPELTIEYRITLISEKAIEVSEQTDSKQELYLFVDFGEYIRWSPDGRYLAFVSRNDYPDNEIVLYDTETKSEKILVEYPLSIRMLDWSPNGKNLVYITFHLDEPFYLEKGRIFSWDVSSSEIKVLGKISEHAVNVDLLGWLDDDRLAVMDEFYDFSPGNVRVLDVAQGKEKTVYEENVGWAALNPITSTFVLDFWNIGWRDQPILQGDVHTIAFPNLEVLALPLSGYSDFVWYPALELFSGKGNNQIILFNEAGEIFLEFPGAFSIIPSPDGLYIVVMMEEGLTLISSDGIHLADYSGAWTDQIIWFPDSQGFFWNALNQDDEDLYICKADNKWQPELLDVDLSSSMYLINE
jgi:WD40 repeat protein